MLPLLIGLLDLVHEYNSKSFGVLYGTHTIELE